MNKYIIVIIIIQCIFVCLSACIKILSVPLSFITGICMEPRPPHSVFFLTAIP